MRLRFRFDWRTRLLWIAKRTGGWDIWLGKKWGWEWDGDPPFSSPHWHITDTHRILYRKHY